MNKGAETMATIRIIDHEKHTERIIDYVGSLRTFIIANFSWGFYKAIYAGNKHQYNVFDTFTGKMVYTVSATR